MSVACSVVKGDTPLNITWFLNGKTIEYYSGIVVNMVNKKLSTLSIDSVNAEHMGEYSCLAQNGAGSTSYSAYLHVNGICFIVIPMLANSSFIYSALYILIFIPCSTFNMSIVHNLRHKKIVPKPCIFIPRLFVI